MRNFVLTYYKFLQSFMKTYRYITVTQLWCVQDFLNNQRDITQKVRKGEQPFLYATHRLDLLHIPIKFHEDIYDSY